MLPAFRLTALLAISLLAAQAGAQFQFDPNAGGFGLSSPGGFDGGEETSELVQLSARYTPASGAAPAMVEVTAQIAEGYHIYSVTQPAGGPQRTELRLDETSGVRRTGDWVADPAPKSHVDEEIWIGLRIEEHFDRVTWRAPIELPPGADPANLRVAGYANIQACTETTCHDITGAEFVADLAPSGTIPTPDAAGDTQPLSPADAMAPPPIEPKTLAKILGFALLGGLILNLMPCVLPVIGLKVLSFAEQAGHDRGKVLAMNLAYTAGLMSVFLLLAALAAFLGYGWGQLYTHAEFKIGMVVLVFAMALSFLGVWEIPLPGFAGGKGASDLQQQEGYSGAFFKGVFTTILATPCSGPFLGTVFGFTLAQPAWVTFLLFGTIGVGMASPYLLIGVFPSLVKSLPKPGAWMETFKQLMGFVLMGTVVYLFSLVSDEHRMPLLATLVAIGFACWWIGSTPITASPARRRGAWLGGAATIAAVAIAAPALMAPSDHELDWTPFSPDRLAAATSSGATVLVDFTADWCPTCQLNSRVAINTERVKQVVEQNGVTPLLADWSDKNETIKQTLESLGSRSIPFLAIFPADRPNEPILLPDVISEADLLAALDKAGASGSSEPDASMPQIEIGEAAVSANYR